MHNKRRIEKLESHYSPREPLKVLRFIQGANETRAQVLEREGISQKDVNGAFVIWREIITTGTETNSV